MRKVMGWLGSILQMVGAVMVASNFVHPYWGYLVMMPGAVIWSALACRARDWSLATMQALFTVINFLGLARWAS